MWEEFGRHSNNYYKVIGKNLVVWFVDSFKTFSKFELSFHSVLQ